MNQHSCLLCLGSNSNRHFHMEEARKALKESFPTIRFGEEMTTEAIGDKFLSPFSNQVAKIETSLTIEEIRNLLKKIEKDNGPSFEADIIKKAKELMVEKGHTYYQSRKLDRVPKEAVEELLGITLPDKQE